MDSSNAEKPFRFGPSAMESTFERASRGVEVNTATASRESIDWEATAEMWKARHDSLRAQLDNMRWHLDENGTHIRLVGPWEET